MSASLSTPNALAGDFCLGSCGAPAKSELLANLDHHSFKTKFNRSPFKISHNLTDHRLFTLDALVALSQELPADRVEYNAGDVPVTQDPNRTPQNGLSIAETIERIENCRSWMVLKNVEKHPEYKELLEACLEEVRPFAELASQGMTHQQGFIFISSPGSMTPFHIDPENNFLLQIQGTKEVWMFDQNDREVISEIQIEEFFAGAHRNMTFDESFRGRGARFDLIAGEGLHFPVVAPHYVHNGPEVSVSFSVTFQTQDSADRQSLHRFNRQLRRLGVKPSDVGQNLSADSRKLSFLRMMRKIKGWTNRG